MVLQGTVYLFIIDCLVVTSVGMKFEIEVVDISLYGPAMNGTARYCNR